jgi:hypothetical protein
LAAHGGATQVDGVGLTKSVWDEDAEGGGSLDLLEGQRPAEAEASTWRND